ncbi:DUF192 domain-containing protein [Novipirellula artificiosorum]|uniref:ACR n=1 Tax=Novipirellula artificiosorum TaxID=2528016 RepID=A0A5C6D5L3_9BACT|nr:DUF192 domain-containing protein [Novipirellula artificiosorum]TWU31134.1 hypothetical protein Poly41_63250 [Novipirellula artificiosorum]
MSKLIDVETGEVLFDRLLIADTFRSRAVGLLGRRKMGIDEAILIRPCKSVHTFLMRMSISVAFVDQSGKVLSVVDHLPPWRVVMGPREAKFVLESAANCRKLAIGQRVATI